MTIETTLALGADALDSLTHERQEAERITKSLRLQCHAHQRDQATIVQAWDKAMQEIATLRQHLAERDAQIALAIERDRVHETLLVNAVADLAVCQRTINERDAAINVLGQQLVQAERDLEKHVTALRREIDRLQYQRNQRKETPTS